MILENSKEKQKKRRRKGLSANLPGNCKFCPKIWRGKTILFPPTPLELEEGLPTCTPPPHPPCSAAYNLNYDPDGGCDENHSHFSSLIVLFPITYKP
jgi:hypothetical protein